MRCGTAADSNAEEAQFAEALAAGRGGTLFIDDVGQLAPALQARLLPLVGAAGLFGTQTHAIRVIAATAQSLDAATHDGRFRADLYYSLKRNTLALPSLAERRKDIPLLVAHFSAQRKLHEDNAREMTALDDARKAFEYDYLVKLLKATAGNVAQAARIAQRNRTEFYKLLARHGLDSAAYKPGLK